MTHGDVSSGRHFDVDAFDRLSQDFPRVPKRIIATMVQGYLDRAEPLSTAVEATRSRILDACAV